LFNMKRDLRGISLFLDEQGSKITATLPDGTAAFLKFELRQDSPWKYARLLAITDYFVPNAYRERGVAAKLTEFALAWARYSGFVVQPACSYIKDTWGPQCLAGLWGTPLSFMPHAQTGLWLPKY
jgi:hypothetical protein